MDNLEVKIFGKSVGALGLDDNTTYFEYNEAFKKENLEISPLKLAIKNTQTYTNFDDRYFNQLAGVFADSLPDKFGNAIINEYYKKKGFNQYELSSIQKLAYIGTSGMGALEYVPAVQNDSIKEVLEIKHLVDEARLILQGNIKTTIPEIMEAGASAGGARAKAIIQWNKQSNSILSGRVASKLNYEQYLIKFDGASEHKRSEDYPKIEYIYMSIAKLCGLKVAEVELMRERDYAHLLVKRFDRVGEKKMHMHSLCGMTHTNFNDYGLYSYEEYLSTVEVVTRKKESVQSAYGHMVFNIIASNQDDHTKNFSFLMDEHGEWDISPIYDLTYSHGTGYTAKHQMRVNGKQGDFVLEDLLSVAIKAGIKTSDARLIIEHVQDIFYENFEKMAKEMEVDKERIERILGNCRRFDV
jgi:serine/threonine-protein kinase HipA